MRNPPQKKAELPVSRAIRLFILPAASNASESADTAGAATVCVEPTDIMRRNHMRFIEHQRDETVHRGMRTSKHSLRGCIDCHAVRDDAGTMVRADDERHFCVGCHVFTAVRIDCFECHADRPADETTALNPAIPFNAIANFAPPSVEPGQ